MDEEFRPSLIGDPVVRASWAIGQDINKDAR